MVLLLAGAVGVMHIICSIANGYTTPTYIALARDPATRAQYAGPLSDLFFTGDRTQTCVPWMQTAYDVALWAIAAHVIRLGALQLYTDGSAYPWERCVVRMFVHTCFMSLCQVVTTMPASGGIAECLEANDGKDWSELPWYGVSFITQAGVGMRACGDMIYSGHMSNMVILVVIGFETYRPDQSRLFHAVVSLVLSFVAAYFIVRCQDHYSVDVVLGLGISVLISLCPQLDQFACKWSKINLSIENSLLGRRDSTKCN